MDINNNFLLFCRFLEECGEEEERLRTMRLQCQTAPETKEPQEKGKSCNRFLFALLLRVIASKLRISEALFGGCLTSLGADCSYLHYKLG